MSIEKLKLLIPISGPGTRRPCGDDEPPFRALLGFCPQWYAKKCGTVFGRRWHEDCQYRYDSLLTMKRALYERFPTIQDFQPKINDLGWEDGCATISGVYGIKLIPMLYGQEVRFPDDDWPTDASPAPFPMQKLRDMPPIDLDNSPVMARFEEQMDEMERRFGRIEGYPNYQGTLNVALKLRGYEILSDLLENPEFAHELLSHIAGTIESVAKRVQARQRKSGFDVDLLSMSNCVVNMISPAIYEEFILPLDKHLSTQFRRFGIHTCNWNATPYFASMAKIEKLGYLDMGFVSALAQAREMFPDTRRTVLYSPVWLNDKPLEEIRKDIERIAEEYAPCDIAMADIMPKTPDEKIQGFLAIVEETAARFC